MTGVTWIFLVSTLVLGYLAQMYKMQRDDLAAFIVYSDMLEDPDSSDE